MKKLFFCAAALFAAISLTACSDSDKNNIKTSDLLGKWVALARYDYSAEAGGYVNSENDKEKDIDDRILIFQDAQTLIILYSENSQYPETWTYTLNGSTITMREVGSNYTRTRRITSLTDTNLELWKKDIDDDYKVVYERRAM